MQLTACSLKSHFSTLGGVVHCPKLQQHMDVIVALLSHTCSSPPLLSFLIHGQSKHCEIFPTTGGCECLKGFHSLTERNTTLKSLRDHVNARGLCLQPQCLPVCSERGLGADHSSTFFLRRLCTGAICFGAF